MIPLILALLLAQPARETLGVHKTWGAFRDRTPARCFAIARPARPGGLSRWQAFASVASWPNRRLRSSFMVRLSRERDRSAPVTLTVGERRFALTANGTDAWAVDMVSDRALVSALRAGRSMSVEAVARGGRPFADVYALAGAATAIDAAALGCVARR